jgi:hypothetical protein
MSKNSILVGLAILGWIGYKKFILAKKINISLKDIGFNGGSFWQPVLNVKLEVENSTDTTADVQKISGNIFLQNKIVGSISQNVNQKILAKQKTIINFNVELNLVDAALISINDKFSKQNIELNGNLIVDFVSFPINYSIQLP